MQKKVNLPQITIEKVDLGCGGIKNNGVGIDREDFGQDIVWDITQGIPLPDNSVLNIHTAHFVEHLDNKEIEPFFREMYRIAKDGATIFILCPHKDGEGAYVITHYSFWDETRVEGIVRGLKNGGADWFDILMNERRGDDLFVKLKVKK